MKSLYEKWFNNNKKCISIISYKNDWNRPKFGIYENGGRKKKGDKLFNLNIYIFYMKISYLKCFFIN